MEVAPTSNSGEYRLMFRRRALLLLVTLTAVGLPSAAALGTTPEIALRVDVAHQGVPGHARTQLRCNPDGGTSSDPARVCAVLHRRPELMRPAQDQEGPCFQGYPIVHLRGVVRGRRIDVWFVSCVGPQSKRANVWATLINRAS